MRGRTASAVSLLTVKPIRRAEHAPGDYRSQFVASKLETVNVRTLGAQIGSRRGAYLPCSTEVS